MEVLKSKEEKRKTEEQVLLLRNRIRKLKDIQERQTRQTNQQLQRTEVDETVRTRMSKVRSRQERDDRESRRQQETEELQKRRQMFKEQRDKHKEMVRKNGEKILADKQHTFKTIRKEVSYLEGLRHKNLEAHLAQRRSVRDRTFTEFKRSQQTQQERMRINQSIAEERYLKRAKDYASEKNEQLSVLRSLEDLEAQLLQQVSPTETLRITALGRLATGDKPGEAK